MERIAPESTALDYVRILWRRKWLIVAAMIAAASVSLFVSARATPVYSASSRVLISPQDISLFQVTGYIAPDPSQIETQVQVVTSPAVAAEVAKQLGADAASVTGVSAAGVGDTRVLQITVKATSPTIAAKAATLYATVYQQQKRDEAIADSVSLSTKLAEKTAEAKQRAEDLEQELALARVPVEGEKPLPAFDSARPIGDRRDDLAGGRLFGRGTGRLHGEENGQRELRSDEHGHATPTPPSSSPARAPDVRVMKPAASARAARPRGSARSRRRPR